MLRIAWFGEKIDQKNLHTSSLANEIYRLQVQYNFPGLVEKCRKLIVKYNLPNVIDEDLRLSKLQWKKIVKQKIVKYSEENLKHQFKSYSKLKEGPLMESDLSMEPYVKNMKLRDARTFYRIRTQMLPAKLNMKIIKILKWAMEMWLL